ncbi:DMT family transporter [Chitinophaga lutea]
MSALSLLLVVLAALLHAVWNLVTKQVKGGLPFFWVVSLISSVLFLPFIGWEMSHTHIDYSWLTVGFAVVSGALHILYFITLQMGYRKADLSIVYPVARGAGPMFSVTGAVLLFGERPGIAAIIGFVLIIGGVVLMTGFRARQQAVLQGIYFGLLTGVFIAGYTLWDKSAVADHGVSAVLITFASMLLPMLVLIPTAIRRSETVRMELRAHWKQALAVAVLQPLSYLLVLIAMKTTPVMYVAPARELSIVFGVFFGINLLKEKDSGRRVVAALVILAGIVLLALS